MIHMANPQSRPVMIAIFTQVVVRPFVRPKTSKQAKITVGWPNGSLMTPVLLHCIHFTCMKLAAVMSLDCPSISFHSVTFLSGMFQSLNLPSREALKKNWSFLGWKARAVTKSMCWKQHRHSRLEICHKRTVLSMEELKRKKFCVIK